MMADCTENENDDDDDADDHDRRDRHAAKYRRHGRNVPSCSADTLSRDGLQEPRADWGKTAARVTQKGGTRPR